MRLIENHRALIIAGSLIFTFSCGCAAGTVGVQNMIESEVASAAGQNMGQKEAGEQRDVQNSVSSEIDEEALAKNCLDAADYYLEKMPDAPLLKEYAEPEAADYAGSSLEIDVNDINATNKAGDIIRKFCKENRIDVDKAKVKDLTREQIAWIDMETFKQSEHGK